METNTPDDFFEAGLDLLAEAGPTAVTVAALCRRVGVTKGSFYHHFPGNQEFLQGLLLFWEAQECGRMEQVAARSGPESPTEVAKLAAAWGIRHEAETAIRALARTDSFAAATQRRVDEGRQEHLVLLFEQMGIESDRAQVLGRLGLSVLIGTQHREHPVNRHRLEETLAEYQRWIEAAAEAARTSPARPAPGRAP